MTVAMLMQNTLTSAQRELENSMKRIVRPLKLKVLPKVPRCADLASACYERRLSTAHSDIEIATAQVPKPITVLADEIGISGDELDPYGKYKAKVDLSILQRLAHRRCVLALALSRRSCSENTHRNGKYICVAGCAHLHGLERHCQAN